MAYNTQKQKMKKLLQHIADGNDEVSVDNVLMSAELAKVDLGGELTQELLFKTPYAEKYGATWNPDSRRTRYGLECQPRSVKWRAFDEALRHSKLQGPMVEAALAKYAGAEAEATRLAKEREEAEKAEAERIKREGQKPPVMGVSDDQLRMIHKMVKQRLSTQFAEIRTAFREFDKDKSGSISPEECTDALMSLNVGVPRKFVEHLVNIADYDRDGEINYAEFARILSVDDITKFKKAGAEKEGLVKKEIEWYKPGITKKEIQGAQTKIREMFEERGGVSKMFRAMDEDHSGACDRSEVRLMVQFLNLDTVIRPQVVEELINLMDVDGDGTIIYKEFARVVTAPDLFNMEDLKERPPTPKAHKVSKREKRRAMGLTR